ncbi:metallophosphoesterase [Paenibacillus sp. sgz302251]|uniref:metallophosphoesterase n=1 Tax=Paenibacillus sp. sgz302251 TaxID=3414493 RepID=UPI003C7D9FE9
MFILIGLLFIALYAFLVFFIGWSGWKWMKPMLSKNFRIAYIVLLIMLATSFIFGQVFQNIHFITYIGSYWLAVFSLLVLLLPLVHLVLWLSRLTRLPKHTVVKWSGFVTLLLLISLIAYGSYNAYTPTVRTYDVSIAKEVPATEQLNIVMASDMHFSLLSGKKHAERMVEEINALKPDIVLFPGDILDDQIEPYLDQGIDKLLEKIEAPYGVYASLGNHDKYKGHTDELIGVLENSGIQVLYDESLTIDNKFTLIGRKDYSDSDRAALSELMAGLDTSKPFILLDHQPNELDIAQQNGIDLILSGHTHYGQVAPANLITGLMFENDWGYLQKGQLHSIVSSGYGFWGPPIRIGSQSEIVQIHVSFGK